MITRVAVSLIGGFSLTLLLLMAIGQKIDLAGALTAFVGCIIGNAIAETWRAVRR